jgi:uncharacterized RDD family membrane protein YckC
VPRPASLARRVNAATIDLLVIVALGWALPTAIPDGVPAARGIRFALFWGVPLLLEPALIRAFGRTVGQAALALRVVPVGRPKAGFARLTLRYWTKLALGWISLFYILFAHRRQAIHDRLFGTAVVHVQSAEETVDPAALVLADPSDPLLPSARRRFVAFVAWAFAAWLALIIGVGVILFAGDFQTGSRATTAAELVANVVLAAVTLGIAHLGADGRLPGARRRNAVDGTAA